MNASLTDKSKFEVVGKDKEKSEAVNRPSIGYWSDAWRRLKKNKFAITGMIIIIVYTVMAIVAPMFSPYKQSETNMMAPNLPISKEHWFGTDLLGRDLWTRVWSGARVSLTIGLIAAIIQTTIGILIGGISGYFGGSVDLVLMRIIEILDAIPFLIFVILIMIIIGSGIIPIIIAFAITGWIGMAKLVRGQVLQLKEQEFMLAAKSMGAGAMRMIFKHLVPNMIGVIIVTLTMRIPQAIFTEAFLSYIGLGVKPPMTSWGQLANLGSKSMRVYPTQLFIPAFFISTTMLSLQLLGDGLRDALDPKLRK